MYVYTHIGLYAIGLVFGGMLMLTIIAYNNIIF